MNRLAPLLLIALGSCTVAATAEPPVCGYQVKRVYPHDPEAFTQGLLYRNGVLFESTGLEGHSTIRKVDLESGAVVAQVPLAPSLFGEGLTDWGNELVSLTWRHRIGFRWDLATLRSTGQFSYQGEGWGLTQDGHSIILSDGGARLRFFDPTTMRERGAVAVTADGAPVHDLNELEWVKGEVLANVWRTDLIARIDPSSGRVTAWIDLSGLRQAVEASGPDDVLNGIAYDSRGDRLFVTGKNWPKLFEVKLADRKEDGAEATPCPPLGSR